MPAARDDYLLRMIMQAAAAMRRLREKLMGGESADEVVRDAGAAIGTLLGPQRSLLERLDPASASGIVGNPDTVRAWSSLLLLQSEAEALRGNEAEAARLAARARALTPDIDAHRDLHASPDTQSP